MANNNYIVCSKCDVPLQHLNESFDHKYVFEGTFAELDKMNRNQRIYPKEEYLKHLTYLRDDLKHPEKGWMIGELGHPSDRFETDLKEASHRVLDVWYDADSNQIKGKIELLDTPNGNIVKNLVDEGMPLCISSRASGSVGKDNKVEIQQIFTWDIVQKPGFENCVLNRVNESADEPNFSEFVRNYCEKFRQEESKSVAPQFGLDESYYMVPVFKVPEVRPEILSGQINTLNENDLINNMSNPIFETENSEFNKPLEIKGTVTDLHDPTKIITVQEDNDAEKSEHDQSLAFANSNNEDEIEKSESESEGDKVEILGVSLKYEGDEEKTTDKEDENDDIIKSVSLVYDKEDGEKSEDEKKSEPDESEETDKTDESCDGESCTDEGDEDKEEVEDASLNEVKRKVTNSKEEFASKLDDLIGKLKDKKKTNEALIQKFPYAGLMNAESFKKFSSLTESDQTKVSNWLTEHEVYNPDSVNRLWESALTETVNDEPIWLKNASDEYRRLYESATPLEQKNLQICAKYLMFESQKDVDTFWQNSGLVEKKEARLINESYVNSLPKIKPQTISENLPYSNEFMENIADIACQYDNL